jgi:hypothetical protein
LTREQLPKLVLRRKPVGKKRKGRLKKKWIIRVEENLKIMKVRNWKVIAAIRREWRRID